MEWLKWQNHNTETGQFTNLSYLEGSCFNITNYQYKMQTISLRPVSEMKQSQLWRNFYKSC